MQKLIEFKLHAGAIPYFVQEVIGGVMLDGKMLGLSRDDVDCYLPNTVVELSSDMFVQRVAEAQVLGLEGQLMSEDEKRGFAHDWLARYGQQ